MVTVLWREVQEKETPIEQDNIIIKVQTKKYKYEHIFMT